MEETIVKPVPCANLKTMWELTIGVGSVKEVVGLFKSEDSSMKYLKDSYPDEEKVPSWSLRTFLIES